MNDSFLFQRSLILCIVFFVSFSYTLSSQDLPVSSDTIAARITKQVNVYPQEKLYVHHDKPYYISGENIWLRAHLVNALTHVYDSTSVYVYGELINPLDSIVDRIKIKRGNNEYAGRFILEEDYPAGSYTARFYTRFLENLGEEYFYTRNIEIGGPYSAKYEIRADVGYSSNNKKVNIDLTFFDKTSGEQISPVNIAVAHDKQQLWALDDAPLIKTKVNQDQVCALSLNVDKRKINALYVEFEHDGDLHRQFLPIGGPDNDFAVDFFPEGGHLLSGVRTNLSFKVLRSDGFSENISGIVFDAAGDTITSFSSLHLGMGVFPFFAKDSMKYHAICTTDKGVSKTVELPRVESHNAYSLSIQSSKDILLFSLLTPHSEPMTEDLFFLLHTGGSIIYSNTWDKESQSLQFPRAALPTGILHCMLVNKDYKPVAERLFFNLSDNYLPEISFENNKETYARRELVETTLNFRDKEGQPLNGNFSIAVTDDTDIRVDSTQNILTSMLLTSELRGHIENPSFYFKGDRAATYALDVLMMTQGWRRYNMAKTLLGEMEYPTVDLEFAQIISGTAYDGFLMNRKNEGNQVSMLDMKSGDYLETTTDKNGRFTFHTLLPDSLTITIRALNAKGKNRIQITVDREQYPAFNAHLPVSPLDPLVFDQYLKKAELKYTLENGIRMIMLDDIVVTGSKKRQAARSVYSSSFNTFMDSDDFKKMGAHSLASVLQRMPGINVSGDKVFIRSSTHPATFNMDGMDYPDLLGMDPLLENIESIEIVRPENAQLFGQGGANGVILIISKSGESIQYRKEVFNIAKATPLGFQKEVEFYSPRYSTPAAKSNPAQDLRSTIYWNPSVHVVDGKAIIKFYTADKISEYSMVLEGITNEGQVFHGMTKIVGK